MEPSIKKNTSYYYHNNPEYRKKNVEYNRVKFNNKYKEDVEFLEKQKAYQREYQRVLRKKKKMMHTVLVGL